VDRIRGDVDAGAAACELPSNTRAGNDAGSTCRSAYAARAREGTHGERIDPRHLRITDLADTSDEETQGEDKRAAQPEKMVRCHRHALLHAQKVARRLTLTFIAVSALSVPSLSART
jgi:hypothetical protein